MQDGNLEPQEQRIKQAAEFLDVEVEKWWQLAVSSRKGKNVKRKDILEMYDHCRRFKRVKYLIVDEVDRFMRSIAEYYYWKVMFMEIGVQIRFANHPEVDPEEPRAVFDELIDIYRAEQSNNERIEKTSPKMIAKIQAGYYPGNPRVGYKTSDIKSLHVPDEPTWSNLQLTMKEIASGTYTISQGLARLHERGFKTRRFAPNAPGGKPIDMYRFKRILTEPYYAGMVTMSDWDVEGKGLHEPMITKAEHAALLAIVQKKGKKFTPRRKNPLFPLSNLMECADCGEGAYLVGYQHSNGKGNFYRRYRCRNCSRSTIPADDLHVAFDKVLGDLQLNAESKSELRLALRRVWQQSVADRMQQVRALEGLLSNLADKKDKLVTSMAHNPELASDIKDSLMRVKGQITEATEKLAVAKDFEKDFDEFTDFALDFVSNWAQRWWQLDYDDRLRCKQILFPGGFSVDSKKKIYTPDMSAVYRFTGTAKGTDVADNSNMEGHLGLEPRTRCLRGSCSNQLS